MALASPREETWGEMLSRHIGGQLIPYVKRLNDIYGPVMGSNNTYRKLFFMENPPEHPTDRLRAKVLLLIAGYDPTGFGLDDELPPGWVRSPAEIPFSAQWKLPQAAPHAIYLAMDAAS